ncbi:MAG: hypothetical protein R3B48_23510 [Kofleriaceae bacterium]
MPDYARHLVRRAWSAREATSQHVLFALCDHYEPLWGKAAADVGRQRVDRWAEGYPKLASPFRDSQGRPPRHSFFFPGEEYQPYFLDRLAALTRAGLGEVEVHLHHDGDTRESLGATLRAHLALFLEHGHLSRDPSTGAPRWAFIHGNWSLANSRPDGRWCGVDDELPLLFELGCYADYTFPSAPDPCQPNQVNKVYWPIGDLNHRRCFEHGEPARVGKRYDDRLLMITGPLALARKGRGLRIENGALTGDDPPTAERVDTWIDQGIHISGRREWLFVKVHTHGALEHTADSLLGDGGAAMHRALARRCQASGLKLHYVTAREMFNVARAAMDGRSGDPSAYYDYQILPPPVASS